VAQQSDAADRLEEVLGALLPDRHGLVTAGSGRSVIWLAPDEFLVITDEAPTESVAALQEALENGPGSVVDLSANRTTFELAGPSARAVLEKACPLDLHPRTFKEGPAVNTNIGHVPVILWKVEAESYRIYPRSSFADYLGRWLVDAMAEYKAPETS
jgi:sarcosine oxidase subunit gamma